MVRIQSLCDKRWTVAYYRLISKESTSENHNDDILNVNVLPSKAKKLNSHQKFSIANEVCKRIANTISFLSDSDFNRRVDQLKELNNLWSQNTEIGFQIFEEFSDTIPRTASNDDVGVSLTTEPSDQISVVELSSLDEVETDPQHDIQSLLENLISKI